LENALAILVFPQLRLEISGDGSDELLGELELVGLRSGPLGWLDTGEAQHLLRASQRCLRQIAIGKPERAHVRSLPHDPARDSDHLSALEGTHEREITFLIPV